MSCWTLLLPLHLAACVSLPEPSKVFITSFNMEHTLHFLPGPETPPSSRFTVETLSGLNTWRKSSWQTVNACLELTVGQTCNLTQDFKDPLLEYRARVRAFVSNQTSQWTMSQWFQPLTDTVLGPPDVTMSGCGNCLLLQLKVPTARGHQQLKDLYRELVLKVRRTRDGAQFTLNLSFKEEVTVTYLQPGVEYCVTVAAKTPFNGKAVTSRPHCAFTSPPPFSSLNVVYILVASFCALGLLLVGLVLCSGPLSFRLMKRHLHRTLSFVLHHGQSRGGAAAEPSAPTSATQSHKESAD